MILEIIFYTVIKNLNAVTSITFKKYLNTYVIVS